MTRTPVRDWREVGGRGGRRRHGSSGQRPLASGNALGGAVCSAGSPSAGQTRPATAEEKVTFRLREELERFVDDRTPGSYEAFTLAHNAIIALVQKDPEALKGARRWFAWPRGFDGPDSDALAIVRIEHMVKVAIEIRNAGHMKWGNPQNAARNLHAVLVASFQDQSKNKTLPSVEDLDDWLARHAPRHVRGKLTTAGIVAEIVHVGRLFGRSSEDRQQTREKVAKALDRRRHPRW